MSMKFSKPKLIAFLNAYTEGISGGDLRFIEIAKRISSDKVVITSLLGRKLCEKRGLHAVYILTAREGRFRKVLLTYLKRTIRALPLPIKLRESYILWSTSDFFPDILPALIYKLRNRKAKWLVSVYHIIPHPLKRPGGFNIFNILSFVGQRLSLFLIAKWADMVQTENNFVRNELMRRYKMPSNKIIVYSSGINTESIDGTAPDESKVYDACFLGRLHKSKGIFDLVEAWKYVCQFKKEAQLAIIGTGSIEVLNELRYKIRRLRLEGNIRFLGFLSEEEKYQVLKRSRLYVLPSYEEGIPITFYEAMYCGLPVVTYYLPTYEDIKDYIVAVPLGDVRKLAEAIIKVLSDENLAFELSNRGKGFAKEHTWDKVADCIISRIEELVRS